MSLSEENVSHERIQRSANDWRAKYPNAAAIFERIPSMDLKEVVSTMFLVDGVRWLLKIRSYEIELSITSNYCISKVIINIG